MKWQPTPIFLPGELHGWRNLVDCNPWGHKEWDKTKQLTYTHILFQILFSYTLLNFIEYSSLWYTVGPCWLTILYTECVYVNPNFLPPALPLW